MNCFSTGAIDFFSKTHFLSLSTDHHLFFFWLLPLNKAQGGGLLV